MSEISQVKQSFSDFSLTPSLLATLDELGFRQMTEIQAKSLPLLLEGSDIIAQSQTGSGKTAAFALPILERLVLSTHQLQALILLPTRELCQQVAREFRRFGRHLPGLKVLVLSGGEAKRDQSFRLNGGVHIVVGTPGRLLDHLSKETLDLKTLRTLVLDEADRMLDMGFLPDIEAILSKAPRQRQTLLFSATYPAEIQSLSQRFQQKAPWIKIESDEQKAPDIKHHLIQVSGDAKDESLYHFFRDKRPDSVIIFCNMKSKVQELQRQLTAWGISAAGLHGDLEQKDRDLVLTKMRNRSILALVATDVAARGLDIELLDCVVNYDFPRTADTFVHRVGRTGRAGAKGETYSLLAPRDHALVSELEDKLDFSFSECKLSLGPTHKSLHLGAPMTTIGISAGRKDKLRPGDILGALTGEAGRMEAKHVGKIHIFERISFVAITQSQSQKAFEQLQKGQIKGRKFIVFWPS